MFMSNDMHINVITDELYTELNKDIPHWKTNTSLKKSMPKE